MDVQQLLQQSGRGTLLILVLSALLSVCLGGTVFLNGPALQDSDLRQIDSYVSSALPIYPKGFQLYNAGAGSRPIIVKMINPERKPGSEQPNAGYYTSLPAIIPQGFEGVATSSFLLGHPLSLPSSIQQQPQQQQHFQQYTAASPTQNQINGAESIGRSSILANPTLQQEPQQQQQEQQQPEEGNGSQSYKTNPVVVETSNFESNLPTELRNPFYSNQNTAFSLARESLPNAGEIVVDMWNTNKIREGKVRDLLTGAGLI